MEFKDKLRAYAKQLEEGVATYLPPINARPRLIHEAMQYSMQAGGKRIRPVLTLATHALFDSKIDPMPAAVAIECIHTYSLIHDDLPALDDAPLRRGKPTSHIRFDESTAILAGDALLTFAFQLVARHYSQTPEIGMRLLSIIGETAGSQRLIGGQVEDILGESKSLSSDELDFIHLNKTSAMIEASIALGATTGGADPAQTKSFEKYGRSIGLAFQIIDDILDATSDAETMGKTVGADAALNKTTYVSLHGLDQSRVFANQLTQDALDACASLPFETDFLQALANHLNQRIR